MLSNLFYYRDKSQREVDILLEDGNGLHAYEIKSAKAFHKEFLNNLHYLKELLSGSLLSTQLIYDGETEIKSIEME